MPFIYTVHTWYCVWKAKTLGWYGVPSGDLFNFDSFRKYDPGDAIFFHHQHARVQLSVATTTSSNEILFGRAYAKVMGIGI